MAHTASQQRASNAVQQRDGALNREMAGTLDTTSGACASCAHVPEPSGVLAGEWAFPPSPKQEPLRASPPPWSSTGHSLGAGRCAGVPQGPARAWSWTKAPRTTPGAPGGEGTSPEALRPQHAPAPPTDVRPPPKCRREGGGRDRPPAGGGGRHTHLLPWEDQPVLSKHGSELVDVKDLETVPATQSSSSCGNTAQATRPP